MGGDPAQTSNPLDVALLRRHISREQHAAGKQFGYLWRHGGGRRAHVSAQEIDRDRRGGSPDAEETQREKRLRKEFNSARNIVVARHGTYGLAVLMDIAIFDRWYWWVMTPKDKISALPDTQRPPMRKALDVLSCLAKHFSGGRGEKVRHTIRDEAEDEPA